jgi:hypothetical protein
MVVLHPGWAQRPWLMRVYFIGLLAFTAVLTVRSPWFAFFTWLGFMHAFRFLDGAWRWVGCAAVAIFFAMAQSEGFHRPTVSAAAIWVLLGAVHLVLVGVFVFLGEKTGQQNEARKGMIAELAEANQRLEEIMAENAGLQAQLLTQAREAGVRVASGKFWSDIAEQRLCAFGGRVLIAATTVRTVCPCVVGVVAVAARMFSEEQLEQLRSFPDIGRDDLIRYFTLTQADVAFVDPGRGRGPADRLGLAVQLCTLPWLGFVPDEVGSAPPVAVARLAERLGLDPGVLEGYGRRSHTRSDHLVLVAKYLSWKSAPAGGGEMKELEQFLLDRAMEHDSPALLFNLATEFLMSTKTIRPGVSILERMIISARTGATALTSELVGHLLTGQRCSDLDRLLVNDAGVGMTRLAWLAKPAVEATASAVLTSVGKLIYLRNLDAHTLDLSMLPAERRRFLATVGRRSTVQALMRREERRYPDSAGPGGAVGGRPARRGHRAVRPGGVGAGVPGQDQDRRGTGRTSQEGRIPAVADGCDPAGAGRPVGPGRAGRRPLAGADRDERPAGCRRGSLEAAG